MSFTDKEPNMSITISALTLGTLAAETAMSTVTLAASGGTAPYTYSIDGHLPNGLSLNSATGAITGTPIVPGDYAFQLDVIDATNATATFEITGTITGVLDAVGSPFFNNVNVANGQLTAVVVAANRQLVVSVNGTDFTYVAGDTAYVQNFEVQYLRRDGIIN